MSNLSLAAFWFLILYLPIQTAFAQSNNSIAQSVDAENCLTIQDADAKMACIDRFIKRHSPSSSTSSNKLRGQWEIRTDTSRFDDSKSVYVSIEAENNVVGWPKTTYRPSLQLRCKEKKTEYYIVVGMSPNVEYGLYDGATVEMRFDKEKSFKLRGKRSTDNEAIFFPNAVSHIKKFFRKEKLLVRFVPFNSSPQEIEFNISGLDQIIHPLRTACKW